MVAKLAVVSLAMVCSSAVAFVPGAKLNAGVRARGRVQMSVVSPPESLTNENGSLWKQIFVFGA